MANSLRLLLIFVVSTLLFPLLLAQSTGWEDPITRLYYDTNPRSYADARVFCQTLGRDIYSPLDQVTIETATYNTWWVGLYRKLDGSWQWVDNTTYYGVPLDDLYAYNDWDDDDEDEDDRDDSDYFREAEDAEAPEINVNVNDDSTYLKNYQGVQHRIATKRAAQVAGISNNGNGNAYGRGNGATFSIKGCSFSQKGRIYNSLCSEYRPVVCGKMKITPDPRPNLVVLLVDDLGWGDVLEITPGAHTPNINQMAREGVRLNQFLTGSAVCSPSRAALLTGRIPARYGMDHTDRRVLYPNRDGGMPENETTIGELMKSAGYKTSYFGKWHLGINRVNAFDGQNLPTRHGFDTYYGYPLSLNPQCDTSVPESFQAAFCYLYDQETVVEQPMKLENMTQRLTSRAVSWINNQSAVGAPYFMFMSYLKVHTPLFVNRGFANRTRRGQYGDVIEEMDWSIGQILDAIRKHDNNTVVVFTSDNGPYREEGINAGTPGPLRGGKANNFEGGIRVPGIFWSPARNWTKGLIVEDAASLMDIVPTFAKLANATLPKDRVYDGIDITSLLERGNYSTSRDVIPHYCGLELVAARWSGYKAHFVTPNFLAGYQTCSVPSSDGAQVTGCPCVGPGTTTWDPPLLFNIDVDPTESNPLNASLPQYAGIVAEIKRRLALHKANMTMPATNQLFTEKERLIGGLPVFGDPTLQPCCNPPYCRCVEGVSGLPPGFVPNTNQCDLAKLSSLSTDVSNICMPSFRNKTCTDQCRAVYNNLKACVATPPPPAETSGPQLQAVLTTLDATMASYGTTCAVCNVTMLSGLNDTATKDCVPSISNGTCSATCSVAFVNLNLCLAAPAAYNISNATATQLNTVRTNLVALMTSKGVSCLPGTSSNTSVKTCDLFKLASLNTSINTDCVPNISNKTCTASCTSTLSNLALCISMPPAQLNTSQVAMLQQVQTQMDALQTSKGLNCTATSTNSTSGQTSACDLTKLSSAPTVLSNDCFPSIQATKCTTTCGEAMQNVAVCIATPPTALTTTQIDQLKVLKTQFDNTLISYNTQCPPYGTTTTTPTAAPATCDIAQLQSLSTVVTSDCQPSITSKNCTTTCGKALANLKVCLANPPSMLTAAMISQLQATQTQMSTLQSNYGVTCPGL